MGLVGSGGGGPPYGFDERKGECRYMRILVLTVACFCVATAICYAEEKNKMDDAIKLFEAGKYEEALPLFELIAKENNTDGVTGYTIGVEKYSAMQEDRSFSLRYLAKIYMSQKGYDKALVVLDELGGIDDYTFPCVQYLIGEIYYLQNHPTYPVAYWRGTFEPPYDTECMAHSFSMRYFVEKEKNPDEAANMLKEPNARLKEDAWATAVVEFLRGTINDAGLLRAAETREKVIFTNYLIGRKYLQNGNCKKARKYFKEVVAAGCRHCIGYALAEKELEATCKN